MGIRRAWLSMSGITRVTGIEMDANANSSSDQAKNLFSEHEQGTPASSGKSSRMTVSTKERGNRKRVYAARSSATKDRYLAANSFDRRIQSLINSGLIAGITPTSIRKRSGAVIPDFVSSEQFREVIGLHAAKLRPGF